MFYWKHITYWGTLVQVNLIKVSFIKLTYAMVKINYMLSALCFWLERLHFSYNFLYFCSVFLRDFDHFKHVFRQSGQMNFPKFSGSSGPAMVVLLVTLRENLPLSTSRMLACLQKVYRFLNSRIKKYRKRGERKI